MKVVEATVYMAGPYTGMMLADLGADVVKIETTKGGSVRGTAGPRRRTRRGVRELQPLEALGGARSQGPGGRDALLELLAGADVFLANWRSGIAESLGLTDDVLAATNPRLVRCFVTGFGPGGPLAAEPAFDTVLQPRSGLTDAITTPGHDPSLIPGYPVDKQVGMIAHPGDPRVIAAVRTPEPGPAIGSRCRCWTC